VKIDPLRVAARLARRHVARAAWANDGKGVPPSPNLAWLSAKVGHAANANAGRVTWLVAAWSNGGILARPDRPTARADYNVH
jgi:hypothetical protein